VPFARPEAPIANLSLQIVELYYQFFKSSAADPMGSAPSNFRSKRVKSLGLKHPNLDELSAMQQPVALSTSPLPPIDDDSDPSIASGATEKTTLWITVTNHGFRLYDIWPLTEGSGRSADPKLDSCTLRLPFRDEQLAGLTPLFIRIDTQAC